MADIFGSNYTKEYINDPSEAANVGDYNGKQRVAIDTFSGASVADVVYCAKLPAGAFILNLSDIGGGTTPVFNVAIGDKLSVDTIITCTLDTGASASGTIWIEYSLD